MKIQLQYRIRPNPTLGWFALAAILLLVAGAAFAGEPRYFAIKGARIVPVVGAPIENGTVVIANGLITAVGKDVTIPPEAQVIDGKGLTVYPGLVDALGDLGMQAGRPAGAAGGGGGGPASAIPGAAQARPSRGPQDRPATTPWTMAADELRGDDRRMETWRNAGFTTAMTSPRTGMFAGQGAVISLRSGDPAGEVVIKTPVALYMTFSSGGGFGGGYPGALMGVLAYIKQVLLDTAHFDAARAAYNANPKAMERPAYDRSLEVMSEILHSGRPILLPGQTPAQIARALDLAKQYKLNAVIYGAQQGYDATTMLSAAKVPVLVSIKWPEKDRDADPDAPESLRSMRFRDRASSTPGALEKAGVKFAFYSDGITSPADMRKNAKKAIDAGLSADGALRAFTMNAAEIYGVADRLGSIETGKIANLIVTDGDIFNDKTKIKYSFVDGEKFESREPARPTEPPQGTLAGKWNITVKTQQGEQTATADISMTADGTLSGSVVTQMAGTAQIMNGWMSGRKFSFQINLNMGGQQMSVSFSGDLEGNTVKGSATVLGQSSEFTGTRPGGGSGSAEMGGGL
ncbi:MAG: amidohydrolase family protein [Acidobacteria bacterium]|nr:amidohydrolase family protein [Acidobacteriota bacterium]